MAGSSSSIKQEYYKQGTDGLIQRFNQARKQLVINCFKNIIRPINMITPTTNTNNANQTTPVLPLIDTYFGDDGLKYTLKYPRIGSEGYPVLEITLSNDVAIYISPS